MADSSEENAKALHQLNLAFFGVITASATHELNNVMGTIEQVSGLLEDMCAAAKQGVPINPDKILNVHERIGKQIQRGISTIKNLNTFAHSVDVHESEFETNSLITNLVILCERFAALKKVQLELKIPLGIVLLKGNPFLFEQIIFTTLDLAMNSSSANGVVALALIEVNAGVKVVTTTSPISGPVDQPERVSILQLLMKQLNGTITVKTEGGENIIELFMPKHKEEK